MIENMTICEYYLSSGYVFVPMQWFSVVAALGFVAGFVVGAVTVWLRRRKR